jgi:predicted lipoprotein with Yx(FWY)xxD motif
MGVGNLTGAYIYNNNSDTWWFGLDTVKSGCAPACVVYESNDTADVNWRCTGAIAPISISYTVNTANVTGFGQILTGGNGYTLYVFTNDAVNQSNCSGACATVWPPLLVSNGQINYPSGLPGAFGAIARADGTLQVTYNGMPLWYYAEDSAPGGTYGQGINGKWFVAQANLTTFPR